MTTAVSTELDLTVNSQLLAHAVRLVKDALPKKASPLPILNNILIRAAGDRLSFYATNLEISLFTSCPAQVTLAGAITLPALKLSEMCEQFVDAPVRLTFDKGQVKISCGKFTSRLQTLPAEDFPTPQLAEGPEATLPAPAFRRLIKQTRYAITDKPTQRVIDGAQLTLTEAFIALAALDGKRLSISSLPRNGGLEMSVLLPSHTLNALVSFPDDGVITVSQNDKTLFFASGPNLLTSRVFDGQFPNLERILPKDHTHLAVIDRALFAAALRRVGLVSDAEHAAYFHLTEGLLTVSTLSADIGDAIEDMPITYTGPSLKMCASWRYVLDFLDQVVQPTVVMALKDEVSPFVLTEGGVYENFLQWLGEAQPHYLGVVAAMSQK